MINPGQRVHELGVCLITSLSDCQSVLELGCGLGDKLAMTPCRMRTGVDAHGPYIEEARRIWEGHGIHFVCHDATTYLPLIEAQPDAVLLLDFLEHLEKDVACNLIESVKKVVKRRIVAFGPLGPRPQTEDRLGMGGDHWQTHHSTWDFCDLYERNFDVAVWNNYTGTYYYATWEASCD